MVGGDVLQAIAGSHVPWRHSWGSRFRQVKAEVGADWSVAKLQMGGKQSFMRLSGGVLQDRHFFAFPNLKHSTTDRWPCTSVPETKFCEPHAENPLPRIYLMAVYLVDTCNAYRVAMEATDPGFQPLGSHFGSVGGG